MEYRAGGKPLWGHWDVLEGRFVAVLPSGAGRAERTITRGLNAYAGSVPPVALSVFIAALRIARAESLDAALADTTNRDRDLGALARSIPAAVRGGEQLFSEAPVLVDAIDRDTMPRRGIAVARVLAEAGFGGRALEWLHTASVTGEAAQHLRRLLANMLGVIDAELAGPSPVDHVERLMWIESLLGTDRTAEAVAAARVALDERSDPALDIIQIVAPWADELLDWVDPEERELVLSRLALWRGDYDEAERRHHESGTAVSAATRVGFLLLSGRGEQALAECQQAVLAWPEHQELALWYSECLLREALLGKAREFGDANTRVLGSHPVARLYRALGGFESLGEPNTETATHYFHRSVVREIFPSEPIELADEASECAQIWRALTRLGGNRTAHLTTVEGGQLRRARIREPRTEVVRIQHQLVVKSVAEVQADLRRFDAEFPGVPFSLTYSAEFDLFVGDYQRALRAFDRSWEETRTRWAYVGSGAALVMLGRYEEALGRFDEGERVFDGLIPGEATHAYRGEALLRLGRHDEALPYLEYAYDVEPRRVGADLVLAQLYRAVGRHDDQARVTETAQRFAACLWHEAGRVDGDLLDTAVGMIRGNRSSHLLTFFDHDSQWRVLPLWNNGPPAVRLQREFSGAVYGDELWTLVQAGWGAGERFVRTASSCDGSSSEV